jgi:hypothetical protein
MKQLDEEATTELLNPRQLLLESNSVERQGSFGDAQGESKMSRGFWEDPTNLCRQRAAFERV